jgi:hypothetical protein
MGEVTQASTGCVDTGKVSERRKLKFDSVDQVMAEVEHLAEAERAGRLRRVGNWTLGQTFCHLATWIEYSYTGAPLKVPFFIRWILRFQKRKFLYEPMRAGVKIPRVPGGTLATEPMSLEDALPRMRRALARLKTEAPTALNPIFGRLSYEEWTALQLRHAELHLGFMIPQ